MKSENFMDFNNIELDALVPIASGGQSKIYLTRTISAIDLLPIDIIVKEINDDCQDLFEKEVSAD